MPYRSPYKSRVLTDSEKKEARRRQDEFNSRAIQRASYEREQKDYADERREASNKSYDYTDVRRAVIIGLCFFGGFALSASPLGLALFGASAISVLTLVLAADKIDEAPMRAVERKYKNRAEDFEDSLTQCAALTVSFPLRGKLSGLWKCIDKQKEDKNQILQHGIVEIQRPCA